MPIAKLLILHNARCGDIQCAVYVIGFFGSPVRFSVRKLLSSRERIIMKQERITVQIKILIHHTVTELTKKCDRGMCSNYITVHLATFASAFIYSELISFP